MAQTPKTPIPEYGDNVHSNHSLQSNGHQIAPQHHQQAPPSTAPPAQGMVSVEVTLPPSFQGLNRCQLPLRDNLSLLDLKQTLSESLHHFDAHSALYIFYHDPSGLLFNDDALTLRDCMNRVDASKGLCFLCLYRMPCSLCSLGCLLENCWKTQCVSP